MPISVHLKQRMSRKELIRTTDNSITEKAYEGKTLNDLRKIADVRISDLEGEDSQYPGLLVFPEVLGKWGDDIGKSPILSLYKGRVQTGNIMGFVGIGDTKVKIGSRFDRDENDYLMHYLLEKVFSVNLFDMRFSSDDESIFDFLVFLFPYYLSRAMEQGVYKEYRTFHHDDTNVRGVINLGRHIKRNMPFNGRISYDTREHSSDNQVTELVRHTIEYISRLPYGEAILNKDTDIRTCVSRIVAATPSYSKSERSSLIGKNLRPKVHPYYSEYFNLQRLCVQILRGEEVKYGRKNDEIYGVLFDGAWLWEEYLDRFISKPCRLIHPQNLLKKHPIKIFTDGTGTRYPDFIGRENKIILDAKYKGYGGKTLNKVQREDLAQVISYMHVEGYDKGGFIFPLPDRTIWEDRKTVRGLGGEMFLLGMPIAPAESYKSFTSDMAKNEASLVEAIIRHTRT